MNCSWMYIILSVRFFLLCFHIVVVVGVDLRVIILGRKSVLFHCWNHFISQWMQLVLLEKLSLILTYSFLETFIPNLSLTYPKPYAICAGSQCVETYFKQSNNNKSYSKCKCCFLILCFYSIGDYSRQCTLKIRFFFENWNIWNVLNIFCLKCVFSRSVHS